MNENGEVNMKVYTTGEKSSVQSNYFLSICPGEHLGAEAAETSDWFNDKNQPLQFHIEFKHGIADVPDSIGKYLVAHGLAAKSRLKLPAIAR